MLLAWESLQGQERIKEELPVQASNYVASKFVSAAALERRLPSPPKR